MCFFFFKQKTAYEMRISDWSSDVCSSDLRTADRVGRVAMRSDVGSTLGAFADDGADLILTILVHPDRVGGRGDAARSHDLDTMRPSAELLACCLETFIDTVRDHGDGVEVAARAVAVIVPALAHLAPIDVAACHRQDFARIEEPRRPKQPNRKSGV